MSCFISFSSSGQHWKARPLRHSQEQGSRTIEVKGDGWYHFASSSPVHLGYSMMVKVTGSVPNCYCLFSICHIQHAPALHLWVTSEERLQANATLFWNFSLKFYETQLLIHHHTSTNLEIHWYTKHSVILGYIYLTIHSKVQKNNTNSGENNSNNTLSSLVTCSFALASLQLFNLHKQNAQNQPC